VLTVKREKFAQAIAAGNSQADAYRLAYCAEKMSAPAVWVESGRLASNPAVALRVAELRKPAVEKAGITLESHLADLQALRDAAADAEQFAAAISAEVARGKASGVHVERTASTVTVGMEDDTRAEALAQRLERRSAEVAGGRTTH
jgi:phage terminase small subunit